MSCGIYKISNKLNQKFYIGKSINIEKRWRDHKKDTDSCPIHVAIQKYGPDQFEFSILELCDACVLNEREIYWIEHFDAYESDMSYNATRGGDGASHPIKLSHQQLVEIIDRLKNSSMSRQAIADEFGVSSATISNINIGKSRKLPGETYPIRSAVSTKVIIDREALQDLLYKTQGDFNKIACLFNVSHMTVRQRCRELGFLQIGLITGILILKVIIHSRCGNVALLQKRDYRDSTQLEVLQELLVALLML